MSRIHNAVDALVLAMADICNPNFYIGADDNDPYIQFAKLIYNKYSTDFDFNQTMTFPVSYTLNPSLNNIPQFNKMDKLNNSMQSSLYHHAKIPFTVSNLPPFVSLPLNIPPIVSKQRQDRLKLIGYSLYKFLIESTLHNAMPNLNNDEVFTLVDAISCTETLTYLANEYKMDLDAIIIIDSTPYEKFSIYLGLYYEYCIRDSNNWAEIYDWMEKYLDVKTNVAKTSPINSASSLFTKIFPNYCDNNPQQLKLDMNNIINKQAEYINVDMNTSNMRNISDNTMKTNNQIDLSEYLQTVVQDLNQCIISSVEFELSAIDYPSNIRLMFKGICSIDDSINTSINAANKKLARSGAALLIAIDKNILPYIKRNNKTFWMEKYTEYKNPIKNKLSLDSRFDLESDNFDSSEGSRISSEDKAINLKDADKEVLSSLNADNLHEVLITLPGYPDNTTIIDAHKYILKYGVPSYSSKDKLYSCLSSKYHLVPRFAAENVIINKFLISLYLDDKLIASCYSEGKKMGGHILAHEYLNQLKQNGTRSV